MIGGTIRSRPYRSDSDEPTTERYCAVFWGKIITEPKITVRDKPHAEFRLKCHAGNTWFKCEAHGDNPCIDVIRRCKCGDMVVVFGNSRKSLYRTQAGDKYIETLSCDLIFPQWAATQMFVGDYIPADVMESLEEST